SSVVVGESIGRRKLRGDMRASRSAATAQEKFVLLNCLRLPGRLNPSETALLLGFQEHDIAPLVSAKLLLPLGKPAPNAPKYFASSEIEKRAQDNDWLSAATKALSHHWLKKKRHAMKRNTEAPKSLPM